MSIFSGKCDIYDEFIAIMKMNNNSDWSKVEIFQYDENHKDLQKLTIQNYKDLVPYFPFIVSSSCSSNQSTKAIISNKSFVDMENEEYINRIFKMAKKYYRKCKRQGIEFVPEEAAKKISFFKNANDLELEVCKRVKKHPYAKKNDISGLHNSIYVFYKKKLYDEMIKVGYTKKQTKDWCYQGIKTW